jgi:hypothetical protein
MVVVIFPYLPVVILLYFKAFLFFWVLLFKYWRYDVKKIGGEVVGDVIEKVIISHPNKND